jgi:hypothetical protein
MARFEVVIPGMMVGTVHFLEGFMTLTKGPANMEAVYKRIESLSLLRSKQ